MPVTKILAIIPNPKDATSFYRAVGPLSAMERSYDIHVDILSSGDELSWNKMLRYDVLFLQRPATNEHLAAIKLAKQLRVPVWVDYDDDVFCIPIDNKAHLYYGQKSVRENIEISLQVADMVTVSTHDLKKAYERFSEKILVCRNAYNDYLIGPFREPQNKKIVCWRGTDTHERDVRHYMDEIISVMKENPDWKFACLGANWWFLAEELKDQYFFQATQSVVQFFSMLYEVGAAIQIVPLYDSLFNRAKSNIAWQEASIVGSATVIPKFDEWSNCHGAFYTNKEGFKESLRYLIKNEDVRLDLIKASRESLNANQRLTKVNEKRVAGLERLINRPISCRN